MVDRPYTLLSCGMSIDGYLDSARITRLALSNDADFDRVDGVRAACDAILVGARTIRHDNPRLLVRSAARRADRVAAGRAESPTKVTITCSGRLDPSAQFFAAGNATKLVYAAASVAGEVRSRVGEFAEVVVAGEQVEHDAGRSISLTAVLGDLSDRGVERLMVEGGGTMHTQLLTGGLADELQLVVGPLFVGDSRSSRFVNDGDFPWNARRRARLAEVRAIGDVALLRYALSERFDPFC